MIETPILNLSVIAPALALVIAALIVLLVDLFLPRSHKQALAFVALLGIVAAFVATGSLWSATEPAFLGEDGMAVADGYALFFNFVFLTVAGLAVLISVDYADRQGLAQGEYYALLLLSTAGMNVMAAATDLIMQRLGELKSSIIGPNTMNVAASQEVTILADKSVPFAVIKKIMSTCTSEGYENVSLAVIQASSAAPAIS